MGGGRHRNGDTGCQATQCQTKINPTLRRPVGPKGLSRQDRRLSKRPGRSLEPIRGCVSGPVSDLGAQLGDVLSKLHKSASSQEGVPD
jgi:hypothetical protein